MIHSINNEKRITIIKKQFHQNYYKNFREIKNLEFKRIRGNKRM